MKLGLILRNHGPAASAEVLWTSPEPPLVANNGGKRCLVLVVGNRSIVGCSNPRSRDRSSSPDPGSVACA